MVTTMIHHQVSWFIIITIVNWLTNHHHHGHRYPGSWSTLPRRSGPKVLVLVTMLRNDPKWVVPLINLNRWTNHTIITVYHWKIGELTTVTRSRGAQTSSQWIPPAIAALHEPRTSHRFLQLAMRSAWFSEGLITHHFCTRNELIWLI